jgi:peptide chain release factor 1
MRRCSPRRGGCLASSEMEGALLDRLAALAQRAQELEALLADPALASDPARRRDLGREHAELAPIAQRFAEYRDLAAQRDSARELAIGADPLVAELAREELDVLATRIEDAERALRRALLPRDPDSGRALFLEVRAGTGGDEAALFAGDLLRMYSRYALAHGWSCEPVHLSPGEHGGYREAIARIEGSGAHAALRFESGGHRVQRVPATEAQGRIHTSACTVAVLPEADEVEVAISPADLRVDTYRASGAGGQHVNKTDSAVRITHLPSGLVVECQEERSQHKNRARALALLSARLLERERRRQREAEAATRRGLIGSGDRSERIRTYNFPQGRVTDHRIELTLYKLAQVLEGDLDLLIEPLRARHEAEQLLALSA